MTNEPRMTGAEVLAECEWLLDGGVHPLVVAEQLGRSIGALEIAAHRGGNQRIRRIYGELRRQEREEKRAA